MTEFHDAGGCAPPVVSTNPSSPEALRAMNGALCDFATRWRMNGDYLHCEGCGRPILASYAESFRHADFCKLAATNETHPWRTLVDLLRPLHALPSLEQDARPRTASIAEAQVAAIRSWCDDEDASARAEGFGGGSMRAREIRGVLDRAVQQEATANG